MAQDSCLFSGEYHDVVWGTPVTDSAELFGQLSLCTQQCGVSWRIVWNKRHHYKSAFKDWDMRAVAAMGEADLDRLCDKEGPWAGKLIQNRKKLDAIIHNARSCCAIDDATPGGLSAFLWRTVSAAGADAAAPQGDADLNVHIPGLSAPVVRDPQCLNAHSPSSPEYERLFGVTGPYSDRLAGLLRRTRESGEGEGSATRVDFEPFKFLGSITLQAFLLQCGLLNGHSPSCARNPRCTSKPTRLALGASPHTSVAARRGGKRRRGPSGADEEEGAAEETSSSASRRLRIGAGPSLVAASCSPSDHVWL